MDKKQKVLVVLLVVVILMAGVMRAMAIYNETRIDERKYIKVTDENRPNISKYDIYTAYDCGLKVNWNWTDNRGYYNVRTPDGCDYFWSKEAIAEYVSNSKVTQYFGD